MLASIINDHSSFVPGYALRSLGQNFVVREKVLSKIIQYAGISPSDRVLEVGSGTGNLTRIILDSDAASITAVEKDDRLFEALKEELQTKPALASVSASASAGLELIHDDILNWVPNQSFDDNGVPTYTKLVSNLPFNITTDMLKLVLPLGGKLCSDVFLLLQDEAAKR